MAPFLVYILRCSDGTYYTGQTNDLEKRLVQHNEGRGGRYTRARMPVELVFSEDQPTRADAMRREARIKKLPRQAKEKLINSGSLD